MNNNLIGLHTIYLEYTFRALYITFLCNHQNVFIRYKYRIYNFYTCRKTNYLCYDYDIKILQNLRNGRAGNHSHISIG